MIELEQVRPHIEGHSLVRAVDRIPRGHVRIETGFLYPDGSSIEFYLVQERPLLPEVKLTDLGQTLAWLLTVQVRPWLSKKRQAFLEDTIRIYDVRQNGGALECALPNLQALPGAIIRLGQACMRVADLTFTRRTALQTAFSEEVEEVLADWDLPYEPNAELAGRYGRSVRVDYLVVGTRTRSAVMTLASGSASQAHNLANEIFRRWYDLAIPTRPEQRVTLFDDSKDVYRDDDLRRLGDLSQVVAISDRTTTHDLLAA
jgi:hypothetical protein